MALVLTDVVELKIGFFQYPYQHFPQAVFIFIPELDDL